MDFPSVAVAFASQRRVARWPPSERCGSASKRVSYCASFKSHVGPVGVRDVRSTFAAADGTLPDDASGAAAVLLAPTTPVPNRWRCSKGPSNVNCQRTST